MYLCGQRTEGYLQLKRPHVFDGWRLTRLVHHKDAAAQRSRADQVRRRHFDSELSCSGNTFTQTHTAVTVGNVILIFTCSFSDENMELENTNSNLK